MLQGGMFFKEFQEMSGRQSILFSTGVVTVFFGVYLIATSQSNSKRDCESDNQHLHCQNGESSSDRLTDLEKCDDKVIEFTRKRADSTVMIMTCIGSPVEIGEGRSSRKMGARNQNHSNSSSCKSSSYDGCDRYVGEISQNKGLYEDENDSVRGLSELVGVGGGDGEGEGDGKGENDSRISLTSKNASSSEKSSLLSAQNKILSKQLQSQLQSQSIPCTMLSIKNPLQATSSPESIFFTTKTPILSNNSSNSEATNTLDCLPPNSGNKILSKDTFLPIHDPISSTRTEGSHPKASGLRSLLPAIISPMLRIRSESACGLLESDEDVAS